MLVFLTFLCAVSAIPSVSSNFGVFPYGQKVALETYYTEKDNTEYQAELVVNQESFQLACKSGTCSVDWPDKLFSATPFHYHVIGTESYRKCAYCNPEDEGILSCSTGETIAVESASWGSSVNALVDYAGLVTCPKEELKWKECTVDISEYVKSTCNGKSQCVIPALFNAKVNKPSCSDTSGNEEQTFAVVQYMCRKKESSPDSVGCLSHLPNGATVSLYPKTTTTYPSLLGKVVVGFMFENIDRQCVGYGDYLDLSLTVGGTKKSVKFISESAVHTAEYDFGLGKEDTQFDVVIEGSGITGITTTISINAATVITYPPTPANLNANTVGKTFKISWKKIDKNFKYYTNGEDDGFYHFSTDRFYIDDAREYCRSLDRSLMPTTRTRNKINLLNKVPRDFGCTTHCEGFVGLRALREYSGYTADSSIFVWEDGSKDFELTENCQIDDDNPDTDDAKCIWTGGQPSDNAPLFNVGYKIGLDDFVENRKNQVFCEKKDFDAGAGSAMYVISVYGPENELVWQGTKSGTEVIGQTDFSVDVEQLANNKTYTYTVAAINGCAVSTAEKEAFFCYDVPPEKFSKSEINVLSLSKDVTFTLELPDMGVSCGVQQNTIEFNSPSCNGSIDGLTATIKCTLATDSPLLVEYKLSNGKSSTQGQLTVTSIAHTLSVLQVRNPRSWAYPLMSNEAYIYYVSADEKRSSYLWFDEKSTSGRSTETTSLSYVILVEDASLKASSSFIVKDVKPSTEIRPLLIPGKNYRVRIGFVDPSTNAESFSDDYISIRTVNDVLGPVITVPEFGTSVQNTFDVRFDFSMDYDSYSVLLSCFDDNSDPVTLTPEQDSVSFDLSKQCSNGYGLKVSVTTKEGAVFMSESKQLVFFEEDSGGCVSQNTELASLAPSGNAVTGLLSVHFEWSNAIDFCTSTSATYSLYIANDDSFVAVSPVASGLRRNYHDYTFEASGTYYWFVELVDGDKQWRTSPLRLTVCTSMPQIYLVKPFSGYTMQVLGDNAVLEYAWSIETPQCYATLYGDLVKYQLIVERDGEEVFDISREGTYAYSFINQEANKRIKTYIRVSTLLQVTESSSVTVNVCTLKRPDTPVVNLVNGVTDSEQHISYTQNGSDKVTFEWSPPDAGKSCPDKSTETLEYIVKILGEDTAIEQRVKNPYFSYSFAKSGDYEITVTADNGSVMSSPCVRLVSVCVRKKPDDFAITYPVDGAVILKAPIITYTETPFNSDCDGGENTYTMYVKKEGANEYEKFANIEDDVNYFDKNGKDSSYCVYVEKSNGNTTPTKSPRVCFEFCQNMANPNGKISIEVDSASLGTGARELVSAAGKTPRGLPGYISTWKTVVFNVKERTHEGEFCGNNPYVSFTAENGDVKVTRDYITEDKFDVDFTMSGTYTMVAALKVDTMELASVSESVTVCIYKRPSASTVITPVDGAVLPPGKVSFRITEIKDWGEDCDWKLMENGGSKSYIIHLKKPTGAKQVLEPTNLVADALLSDEGVYEYFIETVFKNSEHTLSTNSETYTFTICLSKNPSISKLSIDDHADGVALSTSVTISMASRGKDCEEANSDPYFVVALYRFNGASDFDDAKEIVPLKIYSVNSLTERVRLPTLSPLTVYHLTVFTYTNSGKYYAFKSIDFRTRALWCTPDPCKNGICNEFTASCMCSVDYTGKYCDKSVAGALIVVAIVVPLVVVIAAILIILYLIYKRTNIFGLKMPDFSKYMFSMPKLLDDPQIDAQTIEDIVYKDALNDFEWAKTLIKTTEPTEMDNLAKALVYAYEQNGKANKLLQSLIEWEVEQCTEETMLFRSNSASAKCFKVYARMVGLPYLYRVVSPLLNKLLKDNQRQEVGVEVRGDKTQVKGMTTEFMTEYELDLTRVEDEGLSDDFIATSLLTVQFMCQLFLSSLQKTTAYCPTEFRLISNTIKTAVLQKFPEHKIEHALSAFLFLRFFVAALSVPESFGLLDTPPDAHLRRHLIIISKVVSNFSTQVKFGAKEEYMLPMNNFLEANEQVLNLYYESIIHQLSDALTPVQVPDRFHRRSIEVLAVQSKKAENFEVSSM